MFLLAAVVVSSCKKEESQSDIDERIIQEYFTNNNITDAIKLQGGVYYAIDSIGDGSGIYPDISSTVRVHYQGQLIDGTVFDGNFDDTPLDLPLYNSIGGWQIGLPYFEKGSEGRLYIPSPYGYGGQQLSNIPANSVLIFRVKLVNVF